MPGTHNFQQWNPAAANQESDAAYTADTQRSGGAADPSIFASQTANKLFYQITTFMVAFMQSMATKGYTLSDANLSTLTGVMANVVAQTDLAAALAPYAPSASPTFTGTPVGPTPPVNDNSAKLATTGYVQNNFPNYVTNNGFQKFPNGLIMQWGNHAIPGSGTTLSFPIAFTTVCFGMTSNDNGGGGGTSGVHVTSCVPISNTQFVAFGNDYSGAPSATNLSWMAFGY